MEIRKQTEKDKSRWRKRSESKKRSRQLSICDSPHWLVHLLPLPRKKDVYTKDTSAHSWACLHLLAFH